MKILFFVLFSALTCIGAGDSEELGHRQVQKASQGGWYVDKAGIGQYVSAEEEASKQKGSWRFVGYGAAFFEEEPQVDSKSKVSNQKGWLNTWEAVFRGFSKEGTQAQKDWQGVLEAIIRNP